MCICVSIPPISTAECNYLGLGAFQCFDLPERGVPSPGFLEFSNYFYTRFTRVRPGEPVYRDMFENHISIRAGYRPQNIPTYEDGLLLHICIVSIF